MRPTTADGLRWHLADYTSGLGRAIRRAKYLPDRHLGVRLARALAPSLAEPAKGRVDAVVPVPSTVRRRAWRGFELAHLLGAQAANELGVPLVRALHCRHGPPQARLSGAKRLDNLAGRIRAKGPTPARVLLVDDVLTTGATAHACITELLGTTSHLVLVATACVARPDS